MINFKFKSELIKEKIEQLKKTKEEIEKYKQKKREIIMYNKMNIPFHLKQHYESKIPLNIFTCWHSKELPSIMSEKYQKLVKNHPCFNHFFYDENDCRNFIKNNFNNYVLEAYNKLIPCAYKSDLWRYCVLYIYGGIYIDIKFECVNNFNLLALTENEYFVRDIPEKYIYNGLIVSYPNNNILLKAINQIIINVNNNYYGNNSLMPTGPGLLSNYFTLEETKNFEIYHKFTVIENIVSEYYLVYKNTIILKSYKEYRNEQSKTQKNKRYGDLWNDKTIYYKYS